MSKGMSYINKLIELYNVDKRTQADMIAVVDKIDKALDNWSWEDISNTIDHYYAKKNDKNYPKLAQVVAILNTNHPVKASNLTVESDLGASRCQPPSTNIKLISDVFMSVCRAGHIKGVFGFDYFEEKEGIERGWHAYIDKNTCTIKKWRWDWEDAVAEAKSRFPETFKKFQGLSFPEECAFAYKLGVLKL